MRKTNKKNKKLNTKEKVNLSKNKFDNNKNKNHNNKKYDNKKKNIKKNAKQKNIVNRKPKRSLWKKLLTILLIMGIMGVLLVTAFLAYIVLTAPEFNEEAFNVKDQTIIYDIDGEIIAKLGVENRESVTYDQLPQVLIDAIIATEDSRFFQHNGVDLPRFLKASVYQLIGRSDAGGASTLTMQMVKNNLTSTVDSGIKGIIRKFQDIYLSVFKVEKNYTKEEIIELYVNNHCLGSSVFGVGEAAKYYFGKSVSELTLPEASLLAGLFQAPNGHNPYYYLESATARRNTVLTLMVRHGYITQEEADMANSVEIADLLVGIKDKTKYQGYVDNIVTEVKKLTGYDPAIVPMKIYTTMEKNIQDGINSILNNDKWYWKNEDTQAGIAIINVETGAIAALGSGRNRNGERIFNYATQAYRQPGSTAKPIFAYGPGFEYNNFSTYTLFVDEEWSYTNGPSINNWDGKFDGLVTTRYALQYSRNIPALKAYQQIGSKKIQQFAYNLGLDVSLNQNSENYKIINKNTGLDNAINEAYSIGGVAEGFTPLMMASAYSAFASGGYYTDPYSITKIEFRETGEVVEYKATKTRVMKDSTAYLMNNILESAVNYGFAGGAKVSGSHVAAKTGTTNFSDSIMKKHKLPSNAVNDLWTIAYTSDYVIAVWYGYDEVSSTTYNTSGGGQKEALVGDVMKYIPKDKKGWKKPSSVVSVEVEKETWPAKLASANTPSNMKTTEYFIRGTQPTQISKRYAQLNEVSNASVSISGNTATITWVYNKPEVLTDEYITNYFNQTVFGNSKEKLAEERKKYNTETLGDIGFGIYKENIDGTLELLAYTNEPNYTYIGYENVNLIIKAEHQNFKSNASAGIRLNISLSGSANENLIFTLDGDVPTTEVKVGTYSEAGIKNIYYGSINVTNNSGVTIQYQIINGNSITDYTTKESLQTAVNQLPAGTYKIHYIVTYKDKKLSKNRTIILK